jgi:uncharacterized protein UPF0175
MGEQPGKIVTVAVAVPVEALIRRNWNEEEIAQEMRLLWLLEQVRLGRLGHAKAAELAGWPLAHFLLLMGRHKISPFGFAPGELDEELSGLP